MSRLEEISWLLMLELPEDVNARLVPYKPLRANEASVSIFFFEIRDKPVNRITNVPREVNSGI